MRDLVRKDTQLNLLYSFKDFSKLFLLRDSVLHAMLSWKFSDYQLIPFDSFLSKFKLQQ